MILYVLRYWPTLTETFVHDEIAGLRGGGLDVEIAALDPRGDPFPPAPPAPVHARPHRWGWLPALPALFLEALRGPAPPRILWLATLARKARRVHVHFAGEAAVWARAACRRAGVPYGVTVHAVDLFKPHPALADVLRDAALVVTISEHNRALLRERYGVDAEVVRCGVDPDAVATRAPSSPPVILSVGRDVPKKGLDTLVGAAGRLDRAAVVRIVSDLPPQPAPVEILGLLPRSAVLAQLATATVFALPCRRAPDGDMDGVPVVLLEAMAAGLPVVTTAVSGIPEVVDGSVGWIVPPDDPDALAAALREALDDPGEAARRGAAGRARIRELGLTHAAHTAAMIGLLRPEAAMAAEGSVGARASSG